MEGVVDSPESVGASSSTRVQRKRRRKPFRARLRLSIGSSMTATASTKATKPTRIRAQFLRLRLLDSRPKKRRRTTTTTSSSSSVWTFCHHCRCKSRRPKMRCTLIIASAGERCRRLYCDGCIEKRYAMQSLSCLQYILLTRGAQAPADYFDLFADTFACPACSGYYNCSLCAPKRREKYVPERNSGRRTLDRAATRQLLLPYYCSCSSTCFRS